MKVRALPPVEYLRHRFSYDPHSGELRWRTGRLAGKLTGRSLHQGYLKVFIDGHQFLVHRIVWKMAYGAEPRFIDHDDGRRDNNAISNLHSGFRSGNSLNARRRKDNSSGAPGVRQRSPTLWSARIKFGGQEFHLGNFRTKAEAVRARLSMASRLGFSASHGSDARPYYHRSGR